MVSPVGDFAEFTSMSKDCDLIFFDPDNGLEVKSKPKDRKNSCKYSDELARAYANNKSVLVYQHFRR
jgi:hypothetical protein